MRAQIKFSLSDMLSLRTDYIVRTKCRRQSLLSFSLSLSPPLSLSSLSSLSHLSLSALSLSLISLSHLSLSAAAAAATATDTAEFPSSWNTFDPLLQRCNSSATAARYRVPVSKVKEEH